MAGSSGAEQQGWGECDAASVIGTSFSSICKMWSFSLFIICRRGEPCYDERRMYNITRV